MTVHDRNSKRSRQLRLVLMAVSVPAVLTGCGDDEPSGKVLTSREDCAAQTEISPAECEKAYQQALVEHEKLAPRFESEKECNDQFGACQPAPVAANASTTSHSYMPSMSGFLIGYALSQAMQPRGYYGIGGVSPLYRDYRSGGYLRPGGELVGKSSGTVYGKYGNTALPARAMTVSRAGFGSSAAARGGFGGSRSSGSSRGGSWGG